MTNHLKVVDNTDLVRDPYSKAIINVNTTALQEHRKKKALVTQSYKNSSRIDQLEHDIKDMKEMLSQILGHFAK